MDYIISGCVFPVFRVIFFVCFFCVCLHVSAFLSGSGLCSQSVQWFASTGIVWELVVVAVICDIIHLIIGCVVSVFFCVGLK